MTNIKARPSSKVRIAAYLRSNLTTALYLALVAGLFLGISIVFRRNLVQASVGPDFTSETLILGLNEPTAISFLPDGRMLILSRYGTIQVVQPGASQVDPIPFMTLTNINTSDGERGLTGFALDPNFATNNFFYLFYTANSPLRDRVSRFTAQANTASPSSENIVWQDNVAATLWHHGGSVAVGPDGKLYISTGDGFRENEVQALDSYRGKILRVNLDGSIPTDNPFYDGNGPNKDEIWALGLRNPFRFSFDQGTGDMYIGDVGANDPATSIEEVNRWRAGEATGLNFGWPICQGNCAVTGMTNPLYSYPHANRDSSVTGGFVYHGGNFPSAYQGTYFYGDYVQNWIKRLTFDAGGNLAGNLSFEPSTGVSDGPYGEVVDLKQGPDGALYYVDIGITWEGVNNPGTVRRIKYNASNQAPVITSVGADPPSGPGPTLTVSFTASATDAENDVLTYSWVFGDGTSATGPVVTHTYLSKGPYSARLTVSDGTNQTLSNLIPITVGTPPIVFITSPADQSLFRAGDAILYQGVASDPDGSLSAANFSWRIVMLHDTHTHPAAGPIVGQESGTFIIPTSGHELNSDTAFQIILTVTDADGLQTSRAVVIRPDTVNLSFNTIPPGLTLLINNLPRTTPVSTFNIVKNFQLPLSATSPQQLGGNNYLFSSWSDGQPQTHAITVPSASQTYTAQFTQVTPPPVTGSSLTFNGTNSRARFTVLPSMTALTVEGWVKRTADTGRYETFMSDAVNGYGQETVGVYVDGGNQDCGSSPSDQFAWAYTQVGGGWFFQCSGVTANLNAWHHIAVTRDASNTARIFIDGLLRSTITNTPASTGSSGTFGIGDAADAATEYFPGRLDEVRISNIVRYSATFTPQTSDFVTDSNTIALYHLNEGIGQTLADSSGNNRHGFLGTSSAIETSDPQWSTDAPYNAGSPSSPSITNVSPTSGSTAGGQTVTITGTNLTGTTLVTFGGTAATINGTPTATQVVATTPAHAAGVVNVAVTTPGGTTTATGGYTYQAPSGSPPVISSFTPTSGPVGTVVTVTGSGFTGATAVLFNTTSAAAYTVGSDTQITATVPTGATTGPIQVTTAGGTGTSGTQTFTVSTVPSGLVAAYGFEEGSGTSTADASGNGNLGTIANATWTSAGRFGKALSFNGTNAWVTVNDANSLDLTNGMTLEAWVNPTALSGGSSNGWRTVILKQQTSNLVYGLYGNTDQNRPSSHVYIGGDLDTVGTAQLPLNTWRHLAATYDGSTLRLFVDAVQVSTRAVSGNITASSNQLRIGGNSVWGEYFSGLIDEVRVYNRALSQTEIQNDRNAPVNAVPAITTISPNSGPLVGGQSVTITGTNLSGTTGVTFGGTAATITGTPTATQVVVTTPARATAGAVNVVVTTPVGSTTVTGGYTYLAAPTITTISPNSGSTLGGQTVTITGTNLTGTSGVTFGGTAATITGTPTATQVAVTTPARATAGAVNVVVTAPGGTTTSTGGYTYLVPSGSPPVISSFTPTSGPVGTVVTLSGTGFMGVSLVKFNTSTATSFTVVSDTQITATVPSGATSGKISVTNIAGTGLSLIDFKVNLLLNPSFELDANTDNRPDNWTSNNRFTRSNAVSAVNGSFVGRHLSTANNGYTISQTVNNLVAGTSYSFTGAVNIPATSDAFTFTLNIQWRNASNSAISTTTIKQYTASTGGGWDQAVANMVAPAGTTNALVRMVVTSLNATVYVDNFLFGP